MAAVASTSTEILELPQQHQQMNRSPPKSAADSSPEFSYPSAIDASDPNPYPISTSSPSHTDFETQSSVSLRLRSEEYRQLFHLPPDEVLVEDFNCAFQENILIQGHMYLFAHYICFYSNIFGFETKKIIPFQEITNVRKAKTAGFFPNAIEIFAGEKKYFFASFLSRDEAFNLITDGWLQHSNGAKAIDEQQDSMSESSIHENGTTSIQEVQSFETSVNELDFADRDVVPILEDSMLQPNVEDDNMSTQPSDLPVNVEHDVEQILGTRASSPRKTWTWKQEDSDAPKVPDEYTKVAESKFSIKVEDFFRIFFSDDGVEFIASFHERCGDKEFKCSPWYPHDEFGHARDVSFQHPIKIYFGAKCGSCKETQKFRVYRNSHLVIDTSQEITDVPYSDYFRVQGLWDVEKDDESNECCFLRVYVNVAFIKRTVWKGKIMQSTIEECREAYATWIDMAHELLKQKYLEKQEQGPIDIASHIGKDHLENEATIDESSERPHESGAPIRLTEPSQSADINQQAGSFAPRLDNSSLLSWIGESMVKLCSFLKSQKNLPFLLVTIFAVIFLMQLSIVTLLARPQHIHIVSTPDYMTGIGGVGGRSSEAVTWLEKRMYHLKDEMYMVEARLEMMRHEHAQLKAQLKELEHLSKPNK